MNGYIRMDGRKKAPAREGSSGRGVDLPKEINEGQDLGDRFDGIGLWTTSRELVEERRDIEEVEVAVVCEVGGRDHV